MAKASSLPSSTIPWRALLLGALMGYLMAAMSNPGGGISSSGRILHGNGRLLEEEGAEPETEELHGGEEAEEEEEELDPALVNLIIAVIVLFLIVLTILFEVVKESIEEEADVSMEPVIEGLFGELTVLGFLSVVTFCVTKLGIFEELSEKFFGEAEELLEIFEAVHYMLFFIMVFFVINVLVLMHGGKIMSKTWWIYNRACRDEKYMKKLDHVLQSHSEEDKHHSFLKHLCHVLFPRRSSTQQLRLDLQLFRGLRYEFIAERSLDPPFSPHAAGKIEDDFQFGRYLTSCQAHSLAHMVHLSNTTWTFMAVVTVFFYGISKIVESKVEPFAWIWAASGWVFFLWGTYFDYHMIQVLGCLTAVFVPQPEGTNGEQNPLLANSPSLPKWTAVDLAKYMEERPMLARMLIPKKIHPNRQDTLYWLERKGPKVYNTMFQIQMLFTSAYVSLLCLTLLPYMLWESEQTIGERIAYPIISLLPVYLLLSRYQVAAANLTMACNVGVHERPHIVKDVNRAVKVAELIQSFIFMERLQQAAKTGFAAPTSGATTTLSSEDVKNAMDAFDAIDESGDGRISPEELSKYLSGINIKCTRDSFAAMVKALDKDQTGSISREEFLNFYKTHLVNELDEKGIRALAMSMFEDFDLDGSGEITLGEFKTVIENYNVGLTVDDIGDLVAELDEHNNGSINEHEFLHLLMVKHRRLFDRTPLPNLE